MIDIIEFPANADGNALQAIHSDHLAITCMQLKPGQCIPLHEHDNDSKLVVLEGKLQLKLSNEMRMVESGMSVFIPANTPHQANTTDGCQVATIFYSRY
jgi:quercetin dioxygenase-like cupin family protein